MVCVSERPAPGPEGFVDCQIWEETVDPLPRLRFVAVEPFRRRFLAMEAQNTMTRRELAVRLGWYRKASPSMRRGGDDLAPDIGRVSRTLGLKNGQRKELLKYELGVDLCRAMNMVPAEAGV